MTTLEYDLFLGASQALARVCTTTGEICDTPTPELRSALEAVGVTIYAPFRSIDASENPR